MAFEVLPTRVTGGRPGLAIVVALAIGLAVFGAAFATRAPVAAAQKPATVVPSAIAALHLPSRLDCHDIGQPTCEIATRAALALFMPTDGTVVSAGAWGSLVCSNALDCPPNLLTHDATPLGSVIVSFANGPDAWVNVMSRPAATPAGPAPAAYAWLVRWH